MERFAWLANPSPELIWGLLSRGIGLVFLISFVSLWPQVLPIAGRTGIMPIHDALRAIERDFSRPRRWLYFPTLLWLDASDTTLRGLVAGGILAALSAIVGGPHAPYALFFCYLVYLSLDRAITFVYPWDALLFESGFWGAFLPATELLPSVAAVAAPDPAVAWVYRMLVFRVIFGFGKHKFLGTTHEDSGFLKGFFITQPLPTYLGWLAHKQPMPILKLSLFGMFVVELVVPLAVFVPGLWCSLAGLSLIGLMIAIWLTGNFGYFNPLMIVLALSWFDNTTAQQFSFVALVSAQGPVFVHALFMLYTALWILAFPFNTFCAFTWPMWAAWLRVRPRLFTWPIAFARAFAPLRLAHAYGVFPPYSPPSARVTIVTEATWDDQTWHELEHRFWPTKETSKPKWCAPHHERFDQGVVYEAVGLSEMNIYRNMIGRWDPYGHGGPSFPQTLLYRMLRGDVPGDRFYDRRLERERGAPRALRVRSYILEPTSIAESRASGRFWRRGLIGPHFPPLRLEQAWNPPLPAPELWHLDDVIWLRRSRFGQLMRRVRAGEDAHVLVREGARELAADVELFWSQLLPGVPAPLRQSWAGLRACVGELRQRYGRDQLHRFERIAGRYAALLFAKLEPLALDAKAGLASPANPSQAKLKINYYVRLLSCQIVAEGRDAYDAVMRRPELAREHAERMTMQAGHLFQALFRYENLVYQSQMLRLLAAWTYWEGRPALTPAQQPARARSRAFEEWLWGKLDLTEFFKAQFTTEEDRLDIPEQWPRFRLAHDHEIVREA